MTTPTRSREAALTPSTLRSLSLGNAAFPLGSQEWVLEASRALAEAGDALEAVARSGPVEHDREELLDTISDAIGDSMDMDWNYRDGARSVLAALVAENIVKVKP